MAAPATDAYATESRISPKEADFRKYLCDSQAADEIIRLLVGLEEAEEKPEDPVGFLRDKFDSEGLPDIVNGKPRVDVRALLAENDALKAQCSGLESQLAAVVADIVAAEARAHEPLVAALLDSASLGAPGPEGELDVAALYGACAALAPAPPEPTDEEPAREPHAWEQGGAGDARLVGAADAAALRAWAAAAFGHGSALLAEFPALTLAAVVALTAEGAEPASAELAHGCFVACLMLAERVLPPEPEPEPEAA